MAREEAEEPPLPGVQARHDRLFALQSDPSAPVPLGEGQQPPGLSCLTRPHPPCHRSSSPEWAAGVPLLLPATAPPRSARAQALHGHQKTHRVCNARKRNASCFLARPLVPPACPKQVSLSPRRAGHPRGEPRMQIQCPVGDPGVQKVRACGLGQDQGLRPPHQAPRPPSHRAGGNKAAGSRARRGTRAPHKAGDAPGAQGPAHKGSGARAASGP